ncbi:MAG: glycoside hydrolase family 127 protein [Oscillospiraceae bacterium]|jgi:hypothetical protein|nr:glycoside hydrolase family 127 protein [Oscillospiraceae bacterium]
MPAKAVWNRAPLRQNRLSPLPLTAVRPAGWLLRELKAQAALFLESPLDNPPHPRTLESIIQLAYVSGDEAMLEMAASCMNAAAAAIEAQLKPIEAAASAARKESVHEMSKDSGDKSDGDFGETYATELEPERKLPEWVATVLAPDAYAAPQAFIRYFTATGDVKMIKLALRMLTVQARALAQVSPGGVAPETRANAGEFMAALLDVYNRTGQPQLLSIAKRWSDIALDWTGWYTRFPQTQPMYRSLPFSQLIAQIKAERESGDAFGYFTVLSLAARADYAARGLGATAVHAALTGALKDEQAFTIGWEKLAKHHGTALGMCTADMYLAGRNPSQGVYAPAVTEMIHALITQTRMVSQFSAVASAAEALEKLVFSANMASFTPDWRYRQTAQRLNQIECARAPVSSYNLSEDSYLFVKTRAGEPDTAQALGVLSAFTMTSWMCAPGGGLAALSYIPCEVRDRINGQLVKITVESNYPYDGEIRMTVAVKEPIRLTLFLRIPRWAGGATMKLSSGESPECVPGTFLRLERVFSGGDVIELTLPMRARMEELNGAWIERGPVLYALPIDADFTEATMLDGAEAIGLKPISDWRYALLSDTPLSEEPPARPGEPPRIRAAVVPLENWSEKRRAPEPPPREPKPNGPARIVSLVPYASAPLRIAQFPSARSAQAHGRLEPDTNEES